MPEPHYTSDNTTTAYQLHFHFAWGTHSRRPLFASAETKEVVRTTIARVAEERKYHVLSLDVEPDVVRALVSLKPIVSPAEVARFIKGNVATVARKELGLSDCWSRGSFVRSVGSRTNEVAQKYIARQPEKHGVARPSSAAPVHYRDPRDPGDFDQAVTARHEYNLHVVVAIDRRREFLDYQVARRLIDYWLQVCDKKSWILWEAEAVPDHAHLLLGVAPKDSPQDVALSLMNNGGYFLGKYFAPAMREIELIDVWEPSYYVGSVGSATTAQIKAFLANHRDL